MTCGIVACKETAGGLGGPRVRRPPACPACHLPCPFPAPGLPLPAICPTSRRPTLPSGPRAAEDSPAQRGASAPASSWQEAGRVGRGLGSGPTYWTLQNSQGEAKTALSHLLQPLGPPSHDRNALLTIQFRLVSRPWGPGAHHEWHGAGGWGKNTVILLLVWR